MECDHPPHGIRSGAAEGVARLRQRASAFFEGLLVTELVREAYRHRWILEWTRIGDEYRNLAEAARRDRLAQPAREAWLCSLTAFEVARSLSHHEDPAGVCLADKVDLSLSRFETYLGKSIERVEIDGLDQGPLAGFFLPARRHGSAAPAIICVADAEVTLGAMARRLLPAAVGRDISLLLVDTSKASVRRRLKPEHILGCWLDYLEARPDVDSQRIAIYGEGAGASHASRLVLSDRRIAAAACDGGLWASVKRRQSVQWMTGFGQADRRDASPDALLSRRMPCPLLVVVGGRSMVREREAIELQAGYRQAGADCAVVVPNSIPYPLGEVEDFVALDDFIFEWFDCKFGSARQLDSVTFL